MTEKGILSGKGEGIFDPESPVTREEFVKMLVLALFPDETGTGSPYSDVDASMWSFPYIAAANRLGLVYGFTDGGFSPERQHYKTGYGGYAVPRGTKRHSLN